MFISNTNVTYYIAGKNLHHEEIHITTQDEREELLKSLEEKKEMKKRLASELSQFKDCDPATITSIRMLVYSVCPLLSIYKSGAEVILFTMCLHLQESKLELQWMLLTDGQVSLSFILLFPALANVFACNCVHIRKGVWEEGSNFLTDNVFAVKSWCKNKFGLDDSAIDKQFSIPEDFDYVN